MPKHRYFIRYFWLLELFRLKRNLSFEDIQAWFKRKDEQLQPDDRLFAGGYEKRTFQRDLKDLELLFGVEIRFSKRNRTYGLQQADSTLVMSQLLQNFELSQVLRLYPGAIRYLQPEFKPTKGLEHMPTILKALDEQLRISFDYAKYGDFQIQSREVSPLLLKEFKHRWYLLAHDGQADAYRVFALDRIKTLQLQEEPAHTPSHDFTRYFDDCFGIIKGVHEVEEVELEADTLQASYLESMPLHSSQIRLPELTASNPPRFLLRLRPEADFQMELMQFGSRIKVIRPEWLRLQLLNQHKAAVELLSNNPIKQT